MCYNNSNVSVGHISGSSHGTNAYEVSTSGWGSSGTNPCEAGFSIGCINSPSHGTNTCEGITSGWDSSGIGACSINAFGPDISGTTTTNEVKGEQTLMSIVCCKACGFNEAQSLVVAADTRSCYIQVDKSITVVDDKFPKMLSGKTKDGTNVVVTSVGSNVFIKRNRPVKWFSLVKAALDCSENPFSLMEYIGQKTCEFELRDITFFSVYWITPDYRVHRGAVEIPSAHNYNASFSELKNYQLNTSGMPWARNLCEGRIWINDEDVHQTAQDAIETVGAITEFCNTHDWVPKTIGGGVDCCILTPDGVEWVRKDSKED